MIGLMSLVSRSTVRFSSPFSSSRSSCSWKLSVASSSTRCELSLFLSIAWMADGAPTVDLHRRARAAATISSISGRSVGSDTTMTSALPVAAVRDEAVPQHQLGRDRAEQLDCRYGRRPCRRTRAGTARPAAAPARSRPRAAPGSTAPPASAGRSARSRGPCLPSGSTGCASPTSRVAISRPLILPPRTAGRPAGTAPAAWPQSRRP